MKHLLTFFLMTVLIVSGLGKASLTLTNTISDITTKIKSTVSGVTFWQGTGSRDEYVNVVDLGMSYYLYAQNSVVATDDYIHNSFTSNKYHYWNNGYVNTYNSAITFTVGDNGTGQQAIIVTAGDLYLNGAKLDRQEDGSYIVPTSQDLIATFSVIHNSIKSTDVSVITKPCPLYTSTQDIYLQGYTMPDIPAVPEPSTIAMLTIGSLMTFWRRRIHNA